MSTRDRVNDTAPIVQFADLLAFNGTFEFIFPMRDVGEGFFFLFSAVDFTDGVFDLQLQESSDQGATGITIPANRLSIPSIVAKASPSFNVLRIVTPGGMVDSASGIARMVGVFGLKTDFIKANVIASGVTAGARIILQLFGYMQRTPFSINQQVP